MVVSKLELIGKILASKYRKKVLFALSNNPLTPRELEQETDIKISHISFTLAELTKLGLLECATPNLRVGKLYQLTKKGNEIMKEIQKRKRGRR